MSGNGVTNEMRKKVLLELASGQFPERARNKHTPDVQEFFCAALAALLLEEREQAFENSIMGMLIGLGKPPTGTADDLTDFAEAIARVRKAHIGVAIVARFRNGAEPSAVVDMELGASSDPHLTDLARGVLFTSLAATVEHELLPRWRAKAQAFLEKWERETSAPAPAVPPS